MAQRLSDRNPCYLPGRLCGCLCCIYLVDLLSHSFVPRENYIILLHVTIQVLVYALNYYAIKQLECKINAWHCRKTSLTILPSGIALDGQFVSWQNVGFCRWNRYVPAKLMIAVDAGHSHDRHAV
jgi:hypothetical protein